MIKKNEDNLIAAAATFILFILYSGVSWGLYYSLIYVGIPERIAAIDLIINVSLVAIVYIFFKVKQDLKQDK